MNEINAAVLRLPLHGVADVNDQLMISTIRRIERRLRKVARRQLRRFHDYASENILIPVSSATLIL
jgi:GH15 family glucan-1,4-alpha-glucosidase